MISLLTNELCFALKSVHIIPVLEIKVMMHDTKKHCIMVSSIFN